MIDYKKINDSIIYYEERGFARIETPWIVPKYIDDLTRPIEKLPFLINNNTCLVASGEQSFLYLYLKNFLPVGQFQTVTPCFRDDEIDLLHSRYFIKNELIKTDIVNQVELEKIVELSVQFFNKYIKGELLIVPTKEGFDIEYSGMELGSYGIRECEFLKWIYATGCAEPRLSKIENIENQKYGLS